MIAYEKEPWDEVKQVLDALFYDYTIDLEGHLIVHWQNFDIRNENTNEIVDHVDHLWCKFTFRYGTEYVTKWWRSDKNPMKNSYIHPHVSETTDLYCSGNYPQGASLCRDLHYLTTFISRYNRGNAFNHAEISDFKPTLKIDKTKLQRHLQYTYYFNPVTGIPDIKDCELVGITQDEVIEEVDLPRITPSHYVWKNTPIERKWNELSTKMHSINIKDYKDDKFFKDIITAYNRTRAVKTDTQVS